MFFEKEAKMKLNQKLGFLFLLKTIFLFSFSVDLHGFQFVLFDDIFEKNKEILIRTGKLEVGQLHLMRTDFYNNILFLDAKGRQLLLFDQEGKFIKRIGSKGQGPGEFVAPSGLGIDLEGNILVSDSQSRRINAYDKDGIFSTSFIISGLHGPPNNICVDSKGNYYLGAFKIDPDKPQSGEGLFINKYDSKGKYLKSFYPRNTAQLWLLNIYPFPCFDLDAENNIYAAQMNAYEISVFDSEGTVLETIGEAPSYFKRPEPGIEIDYSKFKNQSELIKKLTELSKSWTKLLSIKVIENQYLLLELEMNNLVKGFDKKFTIDILDKRGRILAGGIQSDYKFLCTDKDGYLYFLIHTDEEVTIKEPEYRIGKYKLKLD